MREARAAACLNHPNVVAVHDAETAGDGHFLVMEYVAGTDLAEVVLRDGPLPVGRACDYVRQAALGLQHAHEHGMVHRDITPRNLMLTEQGQMKVLDFGLAYFVGEARARRPLRRHRRPCWARSISWPRSRRPIRSRPTSAPTFTAWAARCFSC